MTNKLEYVTEKEAAKILGIQSGKGSVWRHLRKHAPHIEIVKIFNTNAVKRDELEAWAEGGRKEIASAFYKSGGRAGRKRKLGAALKMVQQRKARMT